MTSRTLKNTPVAVPHEAGARERILAEALHLFSENGFEAVSVREIVEAAGVAKPMLYYYFQSKEELFRGLLQATFDEFFGALNAIRGDKNRAPLERLRGAAELIVNSVKAKPELIRLMLTMVYTGKHDHLWNWRVHHKQIMDLLAALFEQAKAERAIRHTAPSTVLAFHFFELAMNVARGWIFLPDLPGGAFETEFIFGLFMYGAADPRPRAREQAS